MGLPAILLVAALVAADPATPEDAGDVVEGPGRGAGISPIDLIPRLELRQSYARLAGDTSLHETTFEMDLQYVNRLLLRYQMPIGVAKNASGQVTGIGDVEIGIIAVVASTARALLALLGGAVLDTATQPLLGAGKQQVVLGVGAVYKPYPWWLAYTLAQEQWSFAGDDTRPDVNQLNARAGSILFGRQYNWLKLDLDGVVAFPGGPSGRLYGTVEVGSLLVGRIGLFVRTGTQLAGPRQVDYTLTAGVRYLFQLERGKPQP
jgi:hypothetical protein